MRRTLAVSTAVLLAVAVPAFADGDVVATMTGKMLTLQGDAAANTIQIASGGATDAFTVTGTNNTTVNGAASATFRDVRSITVLAGAGDDRVDFGRVNVRGHVRVRLEDGNDTVYFTGTAVRGRTQVRCGAGTDTVRVESSALLHGSFAVRGEAGNDEIQLVGAQFRGRVRIEAGDDDDHVLLQSATFTEFARVEVAGGRGLDYFEVLSSQFLNDLFASLGPDNDRARFANSRFTGDCEVFGGLGADDVLSLESGNVFSRIRTFDGFEEGQP